MYKQNMTQWKQKTLVAAASLALAGISFDASALALGAVTVHSHLGEPLRAEIEVPQISEAEAKTLQAALGSPQAFRAAGVEYNPAVAGVRVTLQRRKNGQAYLRLVGSRPVNEPFLGIVVESSWANGRVVRDYTMLIDPADPGKKKLDVEESKTSTSAKGNVRRPTVAAASGEDKSARNSRRTSSTGSGGGDSVTVRRGDTAYKLISGHVPSGVSLDQMLIALQRANPHAFIRGNVNLLKTGVVISLPTAEQAQAITRKAARRAVVAQSRDFHAYRSGLATHAPRHATAAAGRSDAGAVQAHVQDSGAAQSGGDQLRLTRGGKQAAAEARIAKNRQARENAERQAELKRNIEQLQQLQTAAAGDPAGGGAPASQGGMQVTAPASVTPPPTPPAPVPPAAPVETPPPAPVPPAIESVAPPAPVPPSVETPPPVATPEVSPPPAAPVEPPPPASVEPPPPPPAPEKPAPAPVRTLAPEPEEEPSMLDSLLGEPLIPGIGVGVLLLLGGLGFYRMRQKKTKASAPISGTPSDGNLQVDSFFNSTSNSRVDSRSTTSASSGHTSMAYSPSQLDAAGDVDPVAEADVYLAYGRDMQAEEILKEALLTQPSRVSVHRKLAEIYAKRGDAEALEDIATRAYPLTDGYGSDWDAICVLGAEVDPNNSLYKPGGKPGGKKSAAAPAAAAPASTAGAASAAVRDFGADTQPQAAAEPESPPPAPAPSIAQTREKLSAAMSGNDHAVAPAPDSTIDFDLDVDMDSLSPAAKEPEPPAEVDKAGMIEFDLDALSLDPDSRNSEQPADQGTDDSDDPLATKLALAQEFHSIGDTEGARLMAKEVVAEATGSLKIRAERFLREIS